MTRKVATTAAFAFVAVLHVVILLAVFFSPYAFDTQYRDYPYAPPTRVHFIDRTGRFHLRPFVYATEQDPGLGYREDESRIFPIQFFVSGRFFEVRAPAVIFLLGSDEYGRDIYSRLLYGGRTSLAAGLLATNVSLGLGLVFGITAGFYGGWSDRLLMRGSELFMALPWLYLLLAVRAFLPLHVTPVETLLLVLIIGGVGWVRPARLIRGVALSVKQRGFVLAARGFGPSDLYLMRRHILPSVTSVIVTQATILIPQFILAEVTLSFLGLGIGEPVPSWGNMLAQARQYHTIVEHPWMLAPGLILVPLVMCYLVLADGYSNEVETPDAIG
jgi:peptide/nickel transport system permease protein